MILETLLAGQLQTNCYIVGCERTRKTLVVDPGGDAPLIEEALQEQYLTVQEIVLTHFHFDHMLAAEALCESTGAPLAIHAAGAPLLANQPALFRFFAPGLPSNLHADHLLQAGERLSVGDIEVQIRHTPGHSPDGISLWLPSEGLMLCGDALFREDIGRTDFPGSDQQLLLRSIREQIFTLPDETRLYPGHGPATTVGHEKRHNPWLR